MIKFFYNICNDGKFKSWRKKIIKDVRNLFRLKGEIGDTAIKYIRNLFKLKSENRWNKVEILRDIRNLFWNEEEENHYKPVRVSNFWSNNYIEYESNGNRYQILAAKEYFKKLRLYLNLNKRYSN